MDSSHLFRPSSILGIGVLFLAFAPGMLCGDESGAAKIPKRAGARPEADWHKDATKMLTGALQGEKRVSSQPLTIQQRQEIQERKRTVRRIMAHLDGQNPVARKQAADDLARLNDPKWIAPLFAELAVVSNGSAIAALEVVAKMDSDEADMALASTAIVHPDERVRVSALKLIANRNGRGEQHFRSIYQRAVEVALQDRAQTYLKNTCLLVQELRLHESLPAMISMLVNEVPTGWQLVGEFMETPPVGGGATKYARWNLIRVTESVSNECVLETMVQLTGKDYGYDQAAWHRWWQTEGASMPWHQENVASKKLAR
jgi:hypothetical protein